MAQASILIVDDEEFLRETLRLELEEMGYQVAVASSGEQAVDLLDNAYDLVLTDLLMHGVDGLEVLRQAKARRPDQVVFILTGYGELESAIEALRLGANDYLLKPYDHADLMLRLEKSLGHIATRPPVCVHGDAPLLYLCSECKKVRDGNTEPEGESRWISVEQFLAATVKRDVSHGICPTCYQRKIRELKAMIRGDLAPPRGD